MVAMDVMWAFAEGRYCKENSILTLNFTNGAVKKAFQGCASRAGGRVFQVTIPFPLSSGEQILQTFEEVLKEEKEEHPSSTIRVAVFDHIISMPTMIAPIRKLVKLCLNYGVENILLMERMALVTWNSTWKISMLIITRVTCSSGCLYRRRLLLCGFITQSSYTFTVMELSPSVAGSVPASYWVLLQF
ncbi:hypothetical protein KC19_VG017100, partial [Ceratodon purpureus]